MMRRVNILCSFALLFASHTSLAVTYPLPPEGSRLVGQSLTVTVPDHNTQPLETFAAQYGQGLSNMLEANPGADVFLPKPGSQLTIPQQLILPATVRKGIVVNVAEMRLYYYWQAICHPRYQCQFWYWAPGKSGLYSSAQ